MKIIAKRGEAYLVLLEGNNRGFMFNPENNNARSPEMDVNSFLARGYWTEILNPPKFDLEKIYKSEPSNFYQV